jgi:hypothetical protein
MNLLDGDDDHEGTDDDKKAVADIFDDLGKCIAGRADRDLSPSPRRWFDGRRHSREMTSY